MGYVCRSVGTTLNRAFAIVRDARGASREPGRRWSVADRSTRRDMTANHTPDSTAAEPSGTTGSNEAIDDPNDGPPESTLDVRIDPEGLTRALDGAGALVEECLLAFEDGLVVRARDPADVAMAELRLPEHTFESYRADSQEFGVALDRLRDAVSMADGETVRVRLGERGRLEVTAGEFEYALAPIDPRAVRQVDWIDDDATAARVVLDAADLRRAVRVADLVADYATLSVDPEERLFVVTASGDTDDARLEFDGGDLQAFESGDVESIYTLDYLQRIVRAVPRDVEVTLRFVDTGAAERPLALEHPVVDGEGTGRWLLAPRVKR